MPHLIVIYGAPLSGKTTLAREVAAALGDKTAVVSPDAILHDIIRVHDPNPYAELEVVHTQVRLLVANYLKNRYHVVMEGAFSYLLDGEHHQHENEIDQVLGLMRNLATAPMLVRLTAAPETLKARAEAVHPRRDADGVLRLDAAYRQRYGNRALVLATDTASPDELARDVLERLDL